MKLNAMPTTDDQKDDSLDAAQGRRRWWPRLLLAVLALVLSFAVLEVALRWIQPAPSVNAGLPGLDATIRARWQPDGNSALHVASPNSRLVYEMRPDAKIYVRMFDQHVATNSAGFRDREFQIEKPGGTVRIVALGDSVTFGWNFQPHQRYTERLHARFEAAGTAVEVYNMGVAGYNTLQEAEVARTKAAAYDPDLLLLAYVHNDKEIGSDAGLWYHFTRTRSRAYDFLSLRLQRVWYRMGDGVDGTGLSRLAGLADSRGIPVLVVIFPLLEESADGSYAYQADHERVTRLAEGHGFLVLDLLPVYQQVGIPALHNKPDTVHPNAEGHRIAAETIFRFLSENSNDWQARSQGPR